MGHLDPARITTQMVYLASLTKHLRVKVRKKRKPSQANKSNKKTQMILSQVLMR